MLNVFADSPAELWSLYTEILATIDDDVAAAYTRATQASTKPVQAERQQPRPAAQPKAVIARSPDAIGTTRQSHKPVCQECGADESMQLISWKDKATGELKKAWKCQSCDKWVR